MTLTLATTEDLAHAAHAVVEMLRVRGAVTGPADIQVHSGVQILLEKLRASDVGLVLAGGEDLRSLPDDVEVAAVLPRGDARDVLVVTAHAGATLASLSPGSRIGAAGARRGSFLRAHRHDIQVVPPGNGSGPAGALENGSVDALVLGAEDARRLGLSGDVTEAFDPNTWVPAAGQGASVLLARRDDSTAVRAAEAVDHAHARAGLTVELAALEALGVKGDRAIGVRALAHGRWIRAHGMVASTDGRRIVRGDVTGPLESPDEVGGSLAELLFARGAGSLLRGEAR